MAAHTPDSFAAALLASAMTAVVGARAVVKKGAQNIKTEGRNNVLRSAPTHNAHAAFAITYDEPTLVGTQVRAEVGYDKELPGGAIGNLLEFGGGGDHSPPHRDLGLAADVEEPRLEAAIVTMVSKLL